MQIDLKKIVDGVAHCNLYTGDRCVSIFMSAWECEDLRRDGFFIRKEHKADSAGVINTTADYQKIRYIDGHIELV